MQIASLEFFLAILLFEGASSDGQSGIFVNSAVLPSPQMVLAIKLEGIFFSSLAKKLIFPFLRSFFPTFFYIQHLVKLYAALHRPLVEFSFKVQDFYSDVLGLKQYPAQ